MERSRQGDQMASVGGALLVALGLLFLVQQAFGIELGRYGWPLFVLLPGLAFLTAFALAPKSAAGLAIPGCVITTIGLILAVQNTFNLYQTWAYAWALIPASVGLGLRLMGERTGNPRQVQAGTRMLEGFLLAFVVFAVFFELILDLSHLGGGAPRSIVGPAILILVGIYLLMRRGSAPASNS